MNKLPLKKSAKGDFLLPIAVFMLAVLGTVFIYSASNYSAYKTYGDAFYFVKKQAIGVSLGAVAMVFTCLFDYRKIKKFTPVIAILSFVLLGLVFVPGIGVENYGAKRWIGFGGVTLQPSEISKFALILFSATILSKNPEKARTFKGILPVLIFGGITCVFIILEPNMSITVCVALLMVTMLFAAGMKIWHLMVMLVPALVVGVILIIAEPYRFSRLMAFINPWSNPKGEGYQLLQSLYALGSGGWFGVGLFKSRQKYSFLPFAESDFILSVIGEEIGFVGLVLFFSLLGFIIFRGLKIASKAKDVFGYLLAVGITMIFGIQVIVNALVVTGSIPPTGLPLPLVSSGNTSIIIFMAEMGVLYNISTKGTLTF
ncbi:MAG: putative lipid II flippase FtsW [Clostridiales bacterium]|nr:putative lipid II flippase FtsW [Clostridiales bacterium]